jgi:hypothetical protein
LDADRDDTFDAYAREWGRDHGTAEWVERLIENRRRRTSPDPMERHLQKEMDRQQVERENRLIHGR